MGVLGVRRRRSLRVGIDDLTAKTSESVLVPLRHSGSL